jgi:hypothetical protein
MGEALDRQKYDFLAASGYVRHPRRLAFFNSESRKIFSLQAVEDHDVEWLKAGIAAPSAPVAWQLYFNEPATGEVLEDLRNELFGT